MNFFELFELPLALELDEILLTTKYYELNRKYHPDKFISASLDEQKLALRKSSQVNQGYKILKKKQTRVRHLLELFNAAPEEGKEAMPQEFLLEMMDLNEAIMDYKLSPNDDSKSKIESSIDEFDNMLNNDLTHSFEHFDYKAPSDEALEKIKKTYLKTKYLKRLRDNLEDRRVDI